MAGDSGAELDRVTTLLQNLWSRLPSVDARAKMGAKSSVKLPMSPKSLSLGNSPSISELDVRSLKSLYDSPSMPTYPNLSPKEPFTVEAFVERVNSLLADDKAIIERLIRMASGHELLKANAERARKLALDSSQGLETYQKQVKTLEERNAALVLRNTTLYAPAVSAHSYFSFTRTLLDIRSLAVSMNPHNSKMLSKELSSRNKSWKRRLLSSPNYSETLKGHGKTSTL
jgi:hypothetical protein